MASLENILLYFIAVFFPPLTVFIKTGCGGDLCINIILTLLTWIPGIIHAWYIIHKYPTGTAGF